MYWLIDWLIISKQIWATCVSSPVTALQERITTLVYRFQYTRGPEMYSKTTAIQENSFKEVWKSEKYNCGNFRWTQTVWRPAVSHVSRYLNVFPACNYLKFDYAFCIFKSLSISNLVLWVISHDSLNRCFWFCSFYYFSVLMACSRLSCRLLIGFWTRVEYLHFASYVKLLT